jgi:hypothetical protein
MSEEPRETQDPSANETSVAERSLLGALASDANQVITGAVTGVVTAAALYGGKKVLDKIHSPGPGDGPKAGSSGEAGAGDASSS